MDESAHEVGARQARRRRNLAIITVVFALVGLGSVVLAILNAMQHRWLFLTLNILVAVAAVCGLFVSKQLHKHQQR